MPARRLLVPLVLPALLALPACEEDIATGSTPTAAAPVTSREEPKQEQPVYSSGDYGAALSGAKRAGERTAEKVSQRQQELLKEIDKQLEDG